MTDASGSDVCEWLRGFEDAGRRPAAARAMEEPAPCPPKLAVPFRSKPCPTVAGLRNSTSKRFSPSYNRDSDFRVPRFFANRKRLHFWQRRNPARRTASPLCFASWPGVTDKTTSDNPLAALAASDRSPFINFLKIIPLGI